MDSPVTVLKGVGSKTAAVFGRAGIKTLGDLLEYYPVRYVKYEEPGEISEATDGQITAVCGFLERRLSVRYIKKMQIVTGVILSGEDRIPVSWFNMTYLQKTLRPRQDYIFRGTVKQKGRSLSLVQPQVFSPEEYNEKLKNLQSIYPLTEGLTASMVSRCVRGVLELCPELMQDMLPLKIREKYQLAEYAYAIRQIHFPADQHALMLSHRRLAFDEFLLFILALRSVKKQRMEDVHSYTLQRVPQMDEVIRRLPYTLTDAQMKVWREIEEDMTKPQVMARLVQGDVGSGKTIVAFLALLMAAFNHDQAAIMAPTDILARQHYEGFMKLMRQQGLSVSCVLLTGSVTGEKRREALNKIASGEASVIIGTHALFQEKVTYQKLVLVITDEQHRFGVKQREAFSFKGEQPHTIVMSATPIPRTLAVILYGDLDISVIDQMPVGRLPIKNCVVNPAWRPNAWRFLMQEAERGHQSYVICPMIEPGEITDGENVIEYTEKLREFLPPAIRVGYLHGKMKPEEKNEIMERFLKNEIQILVSTTVIEVGVNVPNATVMMVENASQFGLAQLHQLRGRVGRGRDQGYFIMVNTSKSGSAARRLDILNKSDNGFEIARQDLTLRGPGDLFGVRQSGILNFKIADVMNDAEIMQMAGGAADTILSEDAQLVSGDYAFLKKKLLLYSNNGLKNLNI